MELKMPSIKGTKTEKNLLAAFAGESQARNRYEMYAKKAKKGDGRPEGGPSPNIEEAHTLAQGVFFPGGVVRVQ